MKVSLAKPIPKGKPHKKVSNSTGTEPSKQKLKATQCECLLSFLVENIFSFVNNT